MNGYLLKFSQTYIKISVNQMLKLCENMIVNFQIIPYLDSKKRLVCITSI